MRFAFRWLVAAVGRLRPEPNPVDGARLGRLGQGAWIADRELRFGRRHSIPVRMVVLRGEGDHLTLYSPVDLDEGTQEALAGLGVVSRIVVPNRFHRLFVDRAMAIYPNATLLIPEADGGLGSRFPGRTRMVLEYERLDPDLEVMSVHLREGLDELVLYHDLSESLILADLLFNLQQAPTAALRWFYRLNGIWRKPGHSRLQKLLLLKEGQSCRRFYRWALARPFSQISVAHGQLITGNAREVFYQRFRRFGN